MYRTYASAVRQPASHSHYKAKSGSAIQDQSAAYAARPIDAAKKASVGMEDIRIHYSAALPIQRRASLCDVVQLASHIHELHGLHNTDIPVIPSVKPTMVFESMGTKDAMENVYGESKNYKGNTVCVFGLNKKQGGGGALVKEHDRSEIPHHLVNFSFEWSKPDRMDAKKGYEMPFIEARREIMAQAKRLTLTMRDPDSVTDEQWKEVITPTRADRDLSWSPVYRWMDGDAKDDSSDELDTRLLRAFAKQENAYVATGAYEWRHESDDTAAAAPNYHAFVALVNQKEALLREFYMRCMHEEVYTHERAGDAYAYGAFYLPESTFLMNQAAHDGISSDRNGINLDEDQARESMRFFKASDMTRDKIIYMRQLHVTKPLKREFKDDGYASSLMQFFVMRRYNRDGLETALRKLRQSAFGSQWNPKGDEARKEYGAYKKKCIDDLDAFLRADNKFVSIRQEIVNMRGGHA